MTQHSAFLEQFDHVADTILAPLAARYDEEARFPDEALRALTAAGLMGLPYPTEQGGGGGTYTDFLLGVERLSRVCAATGVVYATHVVLACHPIFAFGTPMQKERFLTPLLQGRHLGAFALTEPQAGTDFASMTSTAERDGEFYVLHGRKTFITNAGKADTLIVFARTGEGRATERLSAFIVSRDDPGLIISAPQSKMGIRSAHICEVSYKDLCIPAERLLGREGEGYSIALHTLDRGRTGIAAQAAGIAAAALEAATAHLQSRQQFGKSLATFQGLRWKLADMFTRVEAARHLVLHAAACLDAGQPCRTEAATAKLFASEAAVYCASEAVQLAGGAGYLKGAVEERLYRDAKITQIYEGTSEVQRMVIAQALLADSPSIQNKNPKLK